MEKIKIALISFLLFSLGIFSIIGCKKSDKTNASGEKIFKIAFASFGPDEAADIVINGYLDGLKEAGYSEGKNLEVTKFHASGEISNIPMMMKNADDKGFDILVPMSTPCLAAAFSTVKKTKIVFVYVYDPLAAGGGKSFTDHLPNVTGVGSFPPIENTFDFMQAIVPNVKRIGIIYNNAEANSCKVVQVAKECLSKRGLELVEVTISGTNEIAQASQALVQKDIQITWCGGDNTVLQALDGLIKASNNAKLPLILNDPEFVGRGAMAAVGISWYETGKAASKLAARVLKGEDPSKIPFENVAVKKVVINQKVADQLGIKISPELLKDAEIIK
jgi:putative tryptophan/tyrosine transport system substrate-binding protein